MNIEYKVEAYNTNTKTWLIRSAPDANTARFMANIFKLAPELVRVGFGWNGAEPIVNEFGEIPECIAENYLYDKVIES